MSDNLSLMYGKQTFKATACTVTTNAYTSDGKKVFPSRVLPQINIVKMLASYDGYKDHGVWFTATFSHKADVILSIKLGKYVHSACRANCMLFLRLRRGGDLIQVDVRPPADASAVNEVLPVFTGHADVITPDEAEGLGVKISAGAKRNLVDQEEVEEEFTVRVIKRGEPRPEIRDIEDKSGRRRSVVVKKGPAPRIKIPTKK